MINSELHFTLEEILQKFSKDFQKKILHSVDLLRKAEKLALAYSPEDGFYLSFSGGKDSQCLYHIAKIAGVKFKTHMGLTSVDPPEVIRFVRKHYPDVDMIRPSISIYNQAVRKGVLPTRLMRWCCKTYKEVLGQGVWFLLVLDEPRVIVELCAMRLKSQIISTAARSKDLIRSVRGETHRNEADRLMGGYTKSTSPTRQMSIPSAA